MSHLSHLETGIGPTQPAGRCRVRGPGRHFPGAALSLARFVRPVFGFRFMRYATMLGLFALFGCHALDGQGEPKSEARTVGAFSEVEVGGRMDVRIHVGAAHGLKLRAEANLLAEIGTEVVGQRLIIKALRPLKSTVGIEADITLPELTELSVSGASKADVRNAKGQQLRIDATGASKIVLAGAVDRLEIASTGASHVDADALTTKETRIDATGASRVGVAVSEDLEVSLSGASHVTYRGEPKVKERVSGAASVRRAS